MASQLLLRQVRKVQRQCLFWTIQVELSQQAATREKVAEGVFEADVESGVQFYGAPPNLPHLC